MIEVSPSNAGSPDDAAVLRVPALRIKQGAERTLYSFAVDGKQLEKFASVSWLRRDSANALLGYQRPEVLRHIAEIRRYLESASPMMPNAIVIAFDERVRFEATASQVTTFYSQPGVLSIPLASDEDADVAGWIVDGQQRAAAIREAQVESFPICVTAFVANDRHEQREQFILVNTTKPLPKGLLYELLPGTQARLPQVLQRRRFPAEILAALNSQTDSPFRGLIQTPTNPVGLIRDNSVLRFLENSLTDGALHYFRCANSAASVQDVLLPLKSYWSAVRDVFPDAWGKAPKSSRLMHGAGLVAMGFVMDAIVDRYGLGEVDYSKFRNDLMLIKGVCSWTEGYWLYGGDSKKWNEIQNTHKDTLWLTSLLLEAYKTKVWKRG